MELEWSEEQCLQLIGAYERQPVLWKPTHRSYFSKNKKKDAWQTISKEIGIDEENIRQKMTSLLGSFRQQKSKGKRSIGTGKARHEVYRSKWFAFKRMHFLLDKNQPRRTVNTSNETLLDTETEAECGEARSSTPPNEDGEIAGPSRILDVNVQTPPPAPRRPPPPRPPPPARPPPAAAAARRTRNEEDPRIEQTFDILQETYQQLNTSAKGDRFGSYGEHIAHKLRSYPVRVASIVEHHMSNIMFQADMGQYDQYDHINYNIPPTTPFPSQFTHMYPPNMFLSDTTNPVEHENFNRYTPEPQ